MKKKVMRFVHLESRLPLGTCMHYVYPRLYINIEYKIYNSCVMVMISWVSVQCLFADRCC